jgi:hypothetical protein
MGGSKKDDNFKKFELCGLTAESVIVPVDSDALGPVETTSNFAVKDLCWAMSRDVPYKARVEGIMKAVRPSSGKVEHIVWASWVGFDRSWNSYVWHDQLLASTTEREAMFKKAQSVAFGRSSSGEKRKKASKPKTTASTADTHQDQLYYSDEFSESESDSSGADDDDDADADADADDLARKRKKKASSAHGGAAAGGGGGGGAVDASAAAVSSSRRAGEDELRRPIASAPKEPPMSAQMSHKPWAADDPRSQGLPLPGSVINLVMPETLIAQLYRSQAWIKEHGFLLPLPRSPTVVDIFNDFVRDGNDEDYGARFSCSQAFVAIFDATFALLLLYKNERPQFEKLKPLQRSGPSTVYGAEHLLRWLSRAPEVLGVVPMEPEVTSMYERILNLLLLYLRAKHRDYFLSV